MVAKLAGRNIINRDKAVKLDRLSLLLLLFRPYNARIRIHFKVLVLHYLYNVSHVGNFTRNFIDYFVASIYNYCKPDCMLARFPRIYFSKLLKITVTIPTIERRSPDVFVKQLWSGNEQHRKLSSKRNIFFRDINWTTKRYPYEFIDNNIFE